MCEKICKLNKSLCLGNAIKHLQLLSKAADSIASGDIVEGTMRHDQAWSMLPTLGLLSTVLPCDHMRGAMQGMINFPAFFGKLSTTGKIWKYVTECSVCMIN